jgi:uncharacterized membrane protein
MADPAPPPTPESRNSETPFSGPEPPDFVWTFRGYKLRASEFTTAMVHFFRAEVQRANIWRQRLDTTTNWAVVTTGAVLSYAFTQTESSHIVIVLSLLLATMFLTIEARRYRYYELWSYRVRLMETDFFAAMLVPPFHPSPDWAETLSENLLHPHFPISRWEALGRRLRRNYLWIYAIIYLAWIAKLWLIPSEARTIPELINRASIGQVDGTWVILVTAIFAAILIFTSLATVTMQAAAGEVLPRFGLAPEFPFIHDENIQHRVRAWFRPSHRRAQFLTLIITDKAKIVAEHIMSDMGRGVTGLPGIGMYTGKEHIVLICALTVTEVTHLRAVVAEEDPQAFVIVSPAHEVLGKGFMPLHEE